ncbi:hypothetical protein [Streptomyces sp. NPDC055189]
MSGAPGTQLSPAARPEEGARPPEACVGRLAAGWGVEGDGALEQDPDGGGAGEAGFGARPVTAGRQIVQENRNRSHVRDPTAVVGSYTRGRASRTAAGWWSRSCIGRFRSPAETRDDMTEGAGKAGGATVAVPAREVAVRGAQVTVECLVLTSDQDGTVRNVPMCLWADDNTPASVGVVTDENVCQDPGNVDVQQAARITLQVRGEMREPIG